MATEVLIDGVRYAPEEIPGGLPPEYLSPHFRKTEFDCNHCGKYGDKISRELVDVLEDVRSHFDCPVTVNSGVRCETHNRNVGGATSSRHLDRYAEAADIVLTEATPMQVHSYLTGKYPGKYGIGKYNSFTHIDVRPGGPARW